MTVRALRRFSILLDVEDVASAKMSGIAGSAKQAGNQMDQTGNKAARLKGQLQGLAVATTAGILALRRLSRTGLQIDRDFATIQETMSATEGEIDAIRKQVNTLGAEMPVTMTEAAGAMRQLAFAGMEVEQAIDASVAVTDLAIAAQMDMSRAAKMVTQQMNAFNIEADNAGQITDSMASVFSDSAIELETLGNSMEYVAATASGLGFSFTETASAIGLLADNALEGSKAGTALNQALNKMTSGAESTQRALSAAGLSMEDFTDDDGEMKSMSEIVRIMSDRLDELDASGEGLQRWLVDMFGQRGARAMRPMIENVDELENKIRDGARAELAGATHDIDELDEREIAEKELILGAEDVEEMQERIEEMDDEEVIDLADEEGIELDEDPMELIEQYRTAFETGDLGEQEIQERLQEAFGFEEQVAKELAADITDMEKGVDDLTESYEEVVKANDLATAQMDTAAGKIEYLRGSISSITTTMYRGFEPTLLRILDGFIKLADIVGENQRALKALGYMLFSTTAFVTLLTAKALVHVGALWLMNTALWANVAATAAWMKAAWPLVAVAVAAAAAYYAFTGEMLTLSKVIDGTVEAATWLYDAIEDTIGVVNLLLLALGPLGWALIGVRKHFGSLTAAAERVADVGTSVLDTLRTWGGAVSDLARGSETLMWVYEGLADTIGQYVDAADVAAGATAILATTIGVLVTGPIFAAISSIGTAVMWIIGLGGAATSAGAALTTLGSAVGWVATVIGGPLLGAIGTALTAAGSLAVAFWPVTIVLAAIATAIIAYQRNWLGFADKVNAGVEKILAGYDRLKSGIGSLASRVDSGIGRMRDAIGGLDERASAGLSRFSSGLSSAASKMMGAADASNLLIAALGPLALVATGNRDSILGLSGGIGRLIDKVKGATNVSDRLESALGPLGAIFTDQESAISGVRNAVGGLTDRFWDFVSSVQDAMSVSNALLAALGPFGWLLIAYRENLFGFADGLDRAISMLRGAADATNIFLAALGPVGWLAIAYRENVLGFADGVGSLIGKFREAASVVDLLLMAIGPLGWAILMYKENFLGTADAVEAGADRMKDALSILKPGNFTRHASKLFGEIEDAVDDIESPLDWLDEKLESIHDWIETVAGMNISLRDLINEFGPLQWVVEKAANAAEAVKGWLDGLDDLTPDFGDVRDEIREFLGPLNDVIEKLKDALDYLGRLGNHEEVDVEVEDVEQDRANRAQDDGEEAADPGSRGDRARRRADLDDDDDSPMRGLSYEPDPAMAFGPGVATAERFAEGINSGEPAIARAMGDTMGLASSYMPSSDAERGPLSTLFDQGRALSVTFAQGILAEIGTIQSAANRISSTLQKNMEAPTPQMGAPQAPMMPGGGGLLSDALGAFGGPGGPIGMGAPGAGMMAQASKEQTLVQRGGDGGTMLDNRHINMQQSPNIDITASQEDVDRGAISREIEQAMDRSQDQAVNRMIDLFRMSTGSTPEGETTSGEPASDPGGEEEEEDEGLTEDDFDEDELPEDWDEWSEEEQQEWLDEQEDDTDDEEDDTTDDEEDDEEDTTDGDDEEDTTDDEEDTTDGGDEE